MRLYLVQHGEAKRKEEDPDRSLTETGKRHAQTAGAFLKRLDVRIGAVWHSGKTRAGQTAEILARTVANRPDVVQRGGLAPNDPVQPVAESAGEIGEDIMIVGHLPFLNKLASLLTAGSEEADVVAFQYAGVVCLEREEQGNWRIRWMVTPEVLA